MNETQEDRLIGLFRSAYKDFPPGVTIRENPPLPDFVVNTDTGERIGIELTEVFQNQRLKESSSLKNKVTDKLVTQLESVLPFKFMANVRTDPSRPLSMSDQDRVVDELVEICYAEFHSLPDQTGKEITHIGINLAEIVDVRISSLIESHGYRNLPAGISSINVYRYDGLPYSHNTQNEGGFVPNLTAAFIQPILDKKEKRIPFQPGLDQRWLVIREGNYYSLKHGLSL